MTLSVKHINELSAAEQAALPSYLRGPDAVVIRESFEGEASEPRHFLRRAVMALKGKTAARNVEAAFNKADALLFFGCAAAAKMGRWAKVGEYDPRPDFRELRRRAMRLTARPGNEWLKGFPEELASYLCCLEGHGSVAGEGA